MSHAVYSPSAMERIIACPGSVELSKDIPRTDTVYSREGTFAHSVAAQCLVSKQHAEHMLGYKEDGFTLDKEMAEHIQVYLDYVRGLVMLSEGQLYVEQKVKLDDDVWGTADAVIVADDRWHVVDLKMGQGVFVSSRDNEQLQTYAAAALSTMSYASALPDEVEMHIVQPRCAAERPYRSSVKSREWLMDQWTPTVAIAVSKAKRPNAALNPGDHCKFCPARDTCPRLRAEALTVAKSVFQDLTLEAAPVKPPSPSHLTPEQIDVALRGQELVETWFKGVNEVAVALAHRGELPGWKLVEKKGLRKWTNETDAYAQIAACGISPTAEPKMVSPAQAEKALTKRLGKAQAEALVDSLAHKPTTGVTLVPFSDPRPAITGGAAVFSPIDPQ